MVGQFWMLIDSVMDVFLTVIDFMEGGEPVPWWNYTVERKDYLTNNNKE